MAPSDPAGLREIQGHIPSHLKSGDNPNPVHHQKYHVIPYFGAGFPLNLKELKEPGARSSLEETRCFSESCWQTVYKNILTMKKEEDRKKGTRR